MSLDRRIVRTRRLLAEAILDLAQEKDLDAISITDITERAEVSRVTFYDHYRDRDDLLIAALGDTLDEITGAARAAIGVAHTTDEPPEAVRMLFRHIHSRIELYRRMLGPQGSARFADVLRGRLTEALHDTIAKPGALAEVPHRIFADYVAGALIGVVHGYIHTEPTPDPDDTARAIWVIYRNSWSSDPANSSPGPR
ncbi:TetR/AcrR family transcriptional regulator [Nocardia arthritidis]|uniref:TetR family transcriptional regulator n=1 Tax=Nocardia arthritidis TaxID=228602 RepID=A0A6G9YLX7_9NOCA|nr:TetR/AcrR family transcriptional regulator [Nocardia arthritidis]QIS14214.1 TetR family transcriptional regulator [Nocardia arthritidis]